MILAFALLLPAGLLSCRHSWLFVEDGKVGLLPCNSASSTVAAPLCVKCISAAHDCHVRPCAVAFIVCFMYLQGGGLSPLWLLLHVGLMVSGVLLGLAGMIVALVSFGSDAPGAASSAHQVLGLIAVGE